jgi:hypothetical protein
MSFVMNKLNALREIKFIKNQDSQKIHNKYITDMFSTDIELL